MQISNWSRALVVMVLGAIALPSLALGTAKPTFKTIPPQLSSPEMLSAIAPHGAEFGEISGLISRNHLLAEIRDNGKSDPLSEDFVPTNYGGAYNILFMTVDIDIDPKTGILNEVVRIDLQRNKSKYDELSFLMPEFEVTEVTDGMGTPLTFETKFGYIYVTPAAELAEDDFYTVIVRATGKPDCDGGMLVACSFGKKISYVTHAHYFPRNPDFDLFKAELRITVPESLTVAATGRFVESFPVVSTANAEGVDPESRQEDTAESPTEEPSSEPPTEQVPEVAKTTFVFSHDYETQLLSFAIAEYSVFHDDSTFPPINAYLISEHASNSSNILELARNILDFYGSIYSPFPFGNLDVVEIGNSFGGGYGPQATIMMMSNVFGLSPNIPWFSSLVQLMSHEIAHQWWGNFVTISKSSAVSLSEGLAEFSSAYHYAKEYDSRSNFVENGLSYMYTVPKEADYAIGSGLLAASSNYQQIAYDKASVVFDMLRYELGDEAFFAGMQLYTDLFGYAVADMYDFLDAMEGASGRDLGWFFEQWILTPGFPDLSVHTEVSSIGNGKFSFVVKVKQDESTMQLTLPIRVTLEGSETPVDLEPMQIMGPESTKEYVLDGFPARMSTDPERIMLQRTYSARQGDLNLNGIADGNDLIDMAVMFHRNIVAEYNGNQYFWPNGSYLPRFDITGDGKINEDDLAFLLNEFSY
ncbi:MAG: hypothetical protein HUU55_12330 [Myxococcales bacterium]|nr:hypothetical protein [Myxococcales bacterium]